MTGQGAAGAAAAIAQQREAQRVVYGRNVGVTASGAVETLPAGDLPPEVARQMVPRPADEPARSAAIGGGSGD